MRRPTSGLMFASLSAVAFGTVAPLVKTAYNAGAELFPLLTLRFAVATALIAVGYRLTGRTFILEPRPTLKLMLLGAVGYALEASLFFAALERAPAGLVTLVFYSYPFLTTALAFAFRLESFHGSTLVALVLGSIGVASLFSVEDVNTAGLLLASAAAAAVAAYFTVAGVITRGIDAGAGAIWTATGAGLATGVAWAFTGQSLPPDALPSGVALGAVTSLAFLALYAAIGLIGPSRTTVAQMLEPVVTVTIAALFLGERITARIAVGALLIVTALPVLATSGRREEIPPPADSL